MIKSYGKIKKNIKGKLIEFEYISQTAYYIYEGDRSKEDAIYSVMSHKKVGDATWKALKKFREKK